MYMFVIKITGLFLWIEVTYYTVLLMIATAVSKIRSAMCAVMNILNND
jgi:hypothetical protein